MIVHAAASPRRQIKSLTRDRNHMTALGNTKSDGNALTIHSLSDEQSLRLPNTGTLGDLLLRQRLKSIYCHSCLSNQHIHK